MTKQELYKAFKSGKKNVISLALKEYWSSYKGVVDKDTYQEALNVFNIKDINEKSS